MFKIERYRAGHACQSPNFDYAWVKQALSASLSPDALSDEEQEISVTEFAELMTEPSATETAIFAERQRLGRGVGLDEHGVLVTPSGPAQD